MKIVLKSLLSGVVIGSIILSCVSVFANQSQVVKVSIGSTVANVNGYDTTLTFAPYIQQPSDSMMIPLRFVSTGLGIDESNIEYNPNTKEITITYNGTTAKFIAGTNKLILNGEEFSMLIENTYPVYTEIKNGSTFIPLRSLELAFGVKIDWEASTKTAILSNGNVVEKVEKSTEQVLPTPVQPTIENNPNKEIEEQQKAPNLTTEERLKQEELLMVELVNQERAKHGLEPLQISEKLMNTTKEKAEDMVKNDYYSHTAPNGYNMARDLNVAENININGGGAEGNMYTWLNSKGHRDNILSSKAKYIGVAISQDIDGTFYAVQQFAHDDKWANE